MKKVKVSPSDRVYEHFIRLYPKTYRQEFGEEMKYVFAETMKDAQHKRKRGGTIRFWYHISIDTGKSLITQHWINYKGETSMKNHDIFTNNKLFAWLAVGTVAILLVPLIAMQFTDEVMWTALDFVIMGVLIFGGGSLFIVAARRIKKHRLMLGALFLLAFLYIWAELAVGIFTNLGS